MNQILKTFNSKDFLIKEYENWYLLLRENQVTIGSLVLIEKKFHTRLSNVSNESFIEFGDIVREIELTLEQLFNYKKINYLMLMMKDKQVHYHIIPRYYEDKSYESILFHDTGWPGLPDLSNPNIVDKSLKLKLKKLIRNHIDSHF
jgi:diadenosine tetraphosphate (Ap4A) HIT family hydrolase